MLEVFVALLSLFFSLVILVVSGGEVEERLHDLRLDSRCNLYIQFDLGKQFLHGLRHHVCLLLHVYRVG